MVCKMDLAKSCTTLTIALGMTAGFLEAIRREPTPANGAMVNVSLVNIIS